MENETWIQLMLFNPEGLSYYFYAIYEAVFVVMPIFGICLLYVSIVNKIYTPKNPMSTVES